MLPSVVLSSISRILCSFCVMIVIEVSPRGYNSLVFGLALSCITATMLRVLWSTSLRSPYRCLCFRQCISYATTFESCHSSHAGERHKSIDITMNIGRAVVIEIYLLTGANLKLRA
ncbi:hypothetical protein KCV07_g80, partial [Aureobasidium melanogenum]